MLISTMRNEERRTLLIKSADGDDVSTGKVHIVLHDAIFLLHDHIFLLYTHLRSILSVWILIW